MKICFISDTHGKHNDVKIEPCDVLIHSGDCTDHAGQASLRAFIRWLEAQPAKHKILIAGNHDRVFEKWENLARALVKSTGPSVRYLQDSGTEIEGMKFWGSPVTPEFYNWAFNRARGSDIKKHWDMIPGGTDVLITHGPPKGYLDYNLRDRFHCGCEELLDKIVEVRPKVHCFGHIHSGYGVNFIDEIKLINASCANERYHMVNAPVYHELTPSA